MLPSSCEQPFTQPSTLFISDLHLDSTRPQVTQLFLKFLHEQAVNSQALYILGDLFESWIGDDDDSALANTVRAALRALTDSGVATFFIRGNRDFLIGTHFSENTGIHLLPDPCVVMLYNKPTLLMHGDLLCTDDTAYQTFRNQVRDPNWQKEFLGQPLAARRIFAAQARAASQAHQAKLIGTTVEAITDVSTATVEATLARYGITQLIHGHTHRPAIHTIHISGCTTQRIVLGDWYEQGSVLRASSNGLELITLT